MEPELVIVYGLGRLQTELVHHWCCTVGEGEPTGISTDGLQSQVSQEHLASRQGWIIAIVHNKGGHHSSWNNVQKY